MAFQLPACHSSFGLRHSLVITASALVIGLPLALAALLPSLCAQGLGAEPATLKDAYSNYFLVGVAVNQRQIDDEDQRGDQIIKAQFDSISPENALKWASVHSTPNGYDFTEADRYVAFGERNHMTIVGHTLIWHAQTPRWVFQDADGRPLNGTNAADRALLLDRMRDHIQTVMGRYKGRIQIWDVVNEALNDNGKLRKSSWERIIGPDYIEKAFQYAHEADPAAILRYNDYSLEDEPKRSAAIALMKKLLAEGVPVKAIGFQEHVQMKWPSVEREDETISAFAQLGLKVMITEMDVNVLGGLHSAEISEMAQQGTANIYANGLPPDVEQALTQRYADLFGVFIKHHNDVPLVTLWGVTDADSWLNMRGRNFPLLFDWDGKPKPAFYSVIKVAEESSK
jgi:endo-1,4-beta-xylanase